MTGEWTGEDGCAYAVHELLHPLFEVLVSKQEEATQQRQQRDPHSTGDEHRQQLPLPLEAIRRYVRKLFSIAPHDCFSLHNAHRVVAEAHSCNDRVAGLTGAGGGAVVCDFN
eukprot:CAMPEP_0177796344 /NCGR_PEP_ID=MMETSP0491_2-20121128/26728_1 /TAXON_ID=63592 /ORGANISM="Tetraselmis chuii, Strain PLY429" /LENGTH=111 /DNA_ID=CAMNT_0019319259 /DNA_START=115 /DNA_END=447 /DNA_ORIENTATION=-